MSRTLRRGTGLVAGAALVLASLSGTPAQAAAGEAKPGATWLSKQLTNGLVHNPNYGGFYDYGLSIDTALALDAIGGRPAQVNAVADALGADLDAYTTFQPYYPVPDVQVSAGGVAKAAVLASTAHQDPQAYGGRNLIAELEQMASASAPTTGRIADEVPPLPDPAPPYPSSDYANTIGQAYAARSLTQAGSQRAADVTDFLLDQQCEAGYFRLYFNADKSAPEQGCVDGAAGSEPDTDATAIALIQLKASGDTSAEVAAALDRGADWLISTQKANGSLGGGPTTSASNANSTGLAGWALGELGRTAQARKAATWVRALQPVDLGACRSKLTAQAGAIAYDSAALKAGRRSGLGGDAQDQWRRTTAQAAPVLSFLPADPKKFSATPAKKTVKRGAKVVVTVKGLAKGENGCVSVGSTGKRVVGTGKALKVTFKAPKKVGRTKVVAQSLDAKATARVTVRR